MVRLEQACVSRQRRRMIGPVDLQLGRTGITAILGPNGSGKTTLLRVLHGLERLKTGRITWDHEVLKTSQSFLFQTPIMLRRSVYENAALFRRLKGFDQAGITDFLLEFELGEFMHAPAHSLSGGEKQRLAMVRALSTDPELILLDEPSANLDRRSNNKIEDHLIRMAGDQKRVVLTSHSLAQVKRLANDVVFMAEGVTYGPYGIDEFFDAPPLAIIKNWLAEV